MEIREIVEELKGKAARLTLPDNVKGAVLFNVAGEAGGRWQAVIEEGRVALAEGAPENPDVTLTADADVVIGLYNKTINPVMAILTRKVKIAGDAALMAQLKGLLGG